MFSNLSLQLKGKWKYNNHLHSLYSVSRAKNNEQTHTKNLSGTITQI